MEGTPLSLALGSCLPGAGFVPGVHACAHTHTCTVPDAHAYTRHTHTDLWTHTRSHAHSRWSGPRIGGALQAAWTQKRLRPRQMQLCLFSAVEMVMMKADQTPGPRGRSPGWPGTPSCEDQLPLQAPRGSTSQGVSPGGMRDLPDWVMLTGVQAWPLPRPYESARNGRPCASPQAPGNQSCGSLVAREPACLQGGEPGVCHVPQSRFWPRPLVECLPWACRLPFSQSALGEEAMALKCKGELRHTADTPGAPSTSAKAWAPGSACRGAGAACSRGPCWQEQQWNALLPGRAGHAVARGLQEAAVTESRGAAGPTSCGGAWTLDMQCDCPGQGGGSRGGRAWEAPSVVGRNPWMSGPSSAPAEASA